MKYPKQFLEQLRNRADLSDVVGRRVMLKQKGREYGGLCPFHNEKTPSFTVSNEKGFFHCFGCGAHGDAVEFIKRYEKLHYPEAIEALAREVGLPLPSPERSAEAKAEYDHEEECFKACEAAAGWFESQYFSDAGFAARAYVEKRHLNDATRSQFRLGYASDAKDGLYHQLRAQGFSDSIIFDAGLAVKPDSGGVYDRFRERLMFPICNARGRVVAFGGRLIVPAGSEKAKKLPKYLNSAETPIFHKRQMLYNLDKAAVAARHAGNIIVTEGYMDAIMVAQAGVGQVVASLGTAFTEDHVRSLWRLADAPTLCMDGDVAGQRAMLKAAEMALPLLQAGKTLKFALMTGGDDPDSFIQNKGKAAFETYIGQAKELHEVIFNAYVSLHPGSTPAVRSALEKQLNSAAMSVQDPSVQKHIRNYFRQSLWELQRNNRQSVRAGAPHSRQKKQSIQALSSPAMNSPTDAIAQQIIKLVLQQPALLEQIEVQEALEQFDCSASDLTGLINAMLELVYEGQGDTPLMAYLEDQRLGDVAQGILAQQRILLPTRAAYGQSEALACIRQWVANMQITSLQADLTQIGQLPADEGTELRMQGLTQEITEKKQAMEEMVED